MTCCKWLQAMEQQRHFAADLPYRGLLCSLGRFDRQTYREAGV